jgi:hydroxymethylglutaryl-CoA lyase
VAEIARRLADAGAHEIALGDTIGAATPADVLLVMCAVRAAAPTVPLRMHFHDTRNMAVANAWTAMCAGAVTLDASIGGLGGCPYAPGAAGNVATEDLLYLFHGAGVTTGLSLDALIATSQWLAERLDRTLPSKLARIGPFDGLPRA